MANKGQGFYYLLKFFFLNEKFFQVVLNPLFTLLMIIGFTDCPDQNSPSKSLEIWNTHVLCLNRSFSLKGLENDVVRAVRFMYSLTSILRHTSSFATLAEPQNSCHHKQVTSHRYTSCCYSFSFQEIYS
mgnify:CR=1 FL=1